MHFNYEFNIMNKKQSTASQNNQLHDPRRIREKQTVDAMIQIYCRKKHEKTSDLCSECSHLSEYAKHRLIHCPFDKDKPTCAKCEVHCYKPDMREKIKLVMKFAGPRILMHHPIMTIRHYIDEMSILREA